MVYTSCFITYSSIWRFGGFELHPAAVQPAAEDNGYRVDLRACLLLPMILKMHAVCRILQRCAAVRFRNGYALAGGTAPFFVACPSCMRGRYMGVAWVVVQFRRLAVRAAQEAKGFSEDARPRPGRVKRDAVLRNNTQKPASLNGLLAFVAFG
ncbi:MAG: hypothetical protein ACLSAP_07975 [Oscillospiraceae bacterium]